MNDCQIICGDSLVEVPRLDANSLDACVTDPPYELGFMGKAWDATGIAYNVDLWLEVFRVLKPGAHLVAFGGTRTYHRMACAIEDAGFEIRDQLQWIYGSGFPKSLDVSKAIDKMAGAERVRVPNPLASQQTAAIGTNAYADFNGKATIAPLAVTDEAKQWNGWGTALKPANEPICLARKPLEKGLTVAQNVVKWGTGAINVDGCRIEYGNETDSRIGTDFVSNGGDASNNANDNQVPNKHYVQMYKTQGRWPANVIHDGSDEVLTGFPQNNPGCRSPSSAKPLSKFRPEQGNYQEQGPIYGDEGSAARFFYCAKADKSDRHSNANNHHPTVKPVDLMRWLCRLVTPPNGIILDPFLGSGSTAKAALIERFKIIGIEIDAEYVSIADARCRELQTGLFQ